MTRHEIALGDLRAIIRPGKREDLDRFAARYVVEQSSDLRIALKRGALRLVRKDNPYGNTEPSVPVKSEKPIQDNSEPIMKAMQDMEKRLIDRLNNQVEKHVGKQGLDEDSVSKLNDAIDALRGITGNTSGAAVSQSSSQDKEYDVEDEKIVDIHERSINRLTKGAKSKIQYKEETQSSGADANIDELEDLL